MNCWALFRTAVMPLLLLLLGLPHSISFAQSATPTPQNPPEPVHTIALGDTWLALAERFDTSPQELALINGAISLQRQPAVGTELFLPAIHEAERYGRLLRPMAGGTLELAARNNRNPWAIIRQNDLRHPYAPLLYRPLFLPGGALPPRELPAGLLALELAPGPITPGAALALRARAAAESAPHFTLDGLPLIITRQEEKMIALGGTGAFFEPGQHLLQIRIGDHPAWEQPLTFAGRDWTWEQVNYTNSAVLDPEAIRLERERLQAIWDKAGPQALWQGPFTTPIQDFVEISSYYGARRSVNGGPYASYHEGTDYSAYGGSPVYAPAAGTVVLAEELAIRGNAIILDHGLGLHSGYYHLSEINVRTGQEVAPGDQIGAVGSTGRSTGNHLHWDLLIGRTWIDPLIWMEQGIATWLSPHQPANPEQTGLLE